MPTATRVDVTRLEEILIATGVDLSDVAKEAEVFKHLRPLGARMITSKPQLQLDATDVGRESAGGIAIPDVVAHGMKEFGLIAWVLALGDDMPNEVLPGLAVLVPEFAGKPIYLHRATPYYIMGEGDVLAVVTP